MAGASIKIGASSSEFQKQMKEVTRELKLVSSECGLATEKAKLFGSTQEKLTAVQKELTAKMQAQNQMVQLYKDRITGINGEIDKQKSKQAELTTKIEDANKKYKESVEQTGKNSEESKKLKEELQGLKEEYAKNEKAIESSNNKLVDANTKMNNTEVALLRNKKALENINKEIDNSKIDKLADGFEKAGDKVTSAGKKMSVVSAGIVGVGTASVAAFNAVDDGADNVLKATGAVGEAAEQLEESYKNVASNIVGDFGSIGSALGEVNTRFGFTGSELEDCTEQFMKFSEITGADATTAVQLVSRAMGDAGIESSEYGSVLDALAVAAQASGIGIDRLTENITKYGAPMRALGYDTKESIAIFASWEKAGVNTEIAFSGMKAAIGKWGKEGKDARKEFKKTIDEIAACPDIAEATSKSIEIFGQKAGPDLADAIQGGRFEFEEMLNVIQGSEGTVDNTFEGLVDGGYNAELTMQNVKLGLAEVGTIIMQTVAPIFQKLTEKLKEVTKWFAGLSDGTKQNILAAAGIVTAIGPVLIVLGSLSKGVSNIIKGFKDVRDFGGKAIGAVKNFGTSALNGAKAAGNFALNLGKTALQFTKNAVQAGISATKFVAHKVATIASTVATNTMAAAQAALNFAMSLNPITLIIIGITALVAAIVVLWNKCEWFRNLCYSMFEGLKAAWNATLEFFKGLWDGFVSGWNAAIEGMKNIWNGVCDFFKIIWDGVCLYFKAVWEFWKGIFEAVGNAIKSIWQGICDALKFAWQVVVDFIKLVWVGWKNIFQTVGNIIKGIWDGICNAIKFVWEGIVNILKSSWNGWKNIFESVGNTIRGIWVGLTGTISSVWNGVVSGVKSAWEGIVTPFKNVINSITDLWSGIRSMFKLPHFSIKGEFSLKPPSIPKVSVDWYYTGGIFKTPTILNGIGVGDAFNGQGAKAEAVIPLDEMYRNISNIVNTAVEGKGKGVTQNFYIYGDDARGTKTAKTVKKAMRDLALGM